MLSNKKKSTKKTSTVTSTNSLHIKEGLDNLSAIEEEQLFIGTPVLTEEIARTPLFDKSPTTESVIVLEEIVMSVSIMGHACEDLMTPWPSNSPISTFFKNNVRVYSKACVPGVNSIGNILRNKDDIEDVQRRFSEAPKSETQGIVSSYANEVRDSYMRDIAIAKYLKTDVSFTPGFDKTSDIENFSRVSNLSAFLCNKDFSFYKDDKNEKIKPTFKEIYNTLGIHVIDIRLRKTAMDGSVSYEQIFSPINLERMDLTNFNLSYKDGITFILKDVLGRRDLVKPALELFGFTGKKNRVIDVSLEQIYSFFQLIGVKYANIMDYTCRACSLGPIAQSLSNTIYGVEQTYKKKPVAFGLKYSKNRNKKYAKRKTIRKKKFLKK
jgi:hypothetical protein